MRTFAVGLIAVLAMTIAVPAHAADEYYTGGVVVNARSGASSAPGATASYAYAPRYRLHHSRGFFFRTRRIRSAVPWTTRACTGGRTGISTRRNGRRPLAGAAKMLLSSQ